MVFFDYKKLSDLNQNRKVLRAETPAKIKATETPRSDDIFSLQNFIAALGSQGRRIGRGYLYEVTFNFNKIEPTIKNIAPLSEDIQRTLTFFCSSAILPGWRADTQRVTIYSIPYEIVTRLEQDPIWLTFNADILHKIPNTFLSGLKSAPQRFSVFGGGPNSPFAPRYKNEYQFTVEMKILDENFYPVAKYRFMNSFLKTVQLIQLGTDNKNIPQVTTEIVYEYVESVLMENSGPAKETFSSATVQPPKSPSNSGFGSDQSTFYTSPSGYSSPEEFYASPSGYTPTQP